MTGNDNKASGKKLLVLGTSFGSVEIVQRAKARGIHTIVTDYYDAEHSLAKQYADETWDISTSDLDALEKKCREEKVDGVIASVSQYNIEMQFRLAERLGLPKYCTWDAWHYTRDKRDFKDLCIRNGVPVATDYYVTEALTDEELDKIQYPVAVKPVDQGGNAGITFCHNHEEVRKAYAYARSVSESPKVVIERFLDGVEYGGFYVLLNGESRLLSFWEMFNPEGELNNIYSISVTLSRHLDQYLEEVDKPFRAAMKEGGYTNGVGWIETIRDKDGHFYVLEAGYRLSGEMLPAPIAEISGFDPINWLIDTSLGIAHTPEDLPAEQRKPYEKLACSYMLWANRDGELTEIRGLEEAAEKTGAQIDFLRQPGFEVKKNSPMGEALFTGNSAQEICDKIRTINETVSIRIRSGEDILVRFTDYDKLLTEK